MSGAIRDLDVRNTGFASAEARFATDITNPDSHEIAGYVDGDLVGRIPSDRAEFGIAGLTEGSHSIDVFTHAIGEPYPDRHGDWEGKRAYLTWQRSADPTVRGYRVYLDAELVATIDEVTVPDAVNVRGVEGELGRITHYGGFTGDFPVNDTVTLTLADEGEYQVTWAEGVTVGNYEAGQTLVLPYGVIVEVQDSPDMYGAASTYEIPVGPAHEWLSDPLLPADYSFTVSAYDAAGNESDPSTAALVRVYPYAEEVQGVHLEWDADTETMRVAWDVEATITAGIAVIRAYTNINTLLGEREPHIIEDNFWLARLTGHGHAAFVRSQIGDGEVKLYLRHSGLASVRMIRFMMPPTAADLNVRLSSPTNVTVLQRPGGALRVEWDYAFDEERDDLEGFEVSLEAASGAPVFAGVIDVSADDAQGYPVARFGFDFPGPYSVTQYAVVRAYSTDQATHLDSDEATGDPDDQTPDAVDPVWGVVQ